MAKELESVSVRPVSGGYIVSVNTKEEYEDEESERHTDWETEESVALSKEDAIKIVSSTL